MKKVTKFTKATKTNAILATLSLLSILILTSTASSYASTCPTISLNCRYDLQSPEGSKSKSKSLKGLLSNSTSQVAPSSCVGSVDVVSELIPLTFFQVVFDEHQNVKAYTGTSYSLLSPVFEIQAELRQPFKMTVGRESLTCVLN
jgi:hypothetical protein